MQEQLKQEEIRQEDLRHEACRREEDRQEYGRHEETHQRDAKQEQVEAAADAGNKVGERTARGSGAGGKSVMAGINMGAKTKEEVIVGIRKIAERLGRLPHREQVCRELGVSQLRISQLFGTYRLALKAVKMAGVTAGRVTMEELFFDWVAVVRATARMPRVRDYEKVSQYCNRPLKDRFGSWNDVPAAMLEFGCAKGLWDGYEDVKAMTEVHLEELTRAHRRPERRTYTREDVDVDMIYGEPLYACPMANAPINEDGVLVLFGMMARQLNFVVLRIRGKYPDGEVLRRLPDGTWIRLRIEFEFLSRNFAQHGHDPAKCDLVVCWENNWPECPVEVLELSKLLASSR